MLAKDLEWSDFIAVYAAGLATYTYAADRARREFTASVSMSHGFIAHGPRLTDVLILSATNPGERAITMNGWGLLTSGDRQLIFPQMPQLVTFPHELQPGKELQVYLETRNFCVEMKRAGFHGRQKFYGFYRDQLGKKFKSKKFVFDVDEWLRKNLPGSSKH